MRFSSPSFLHDWSVATGYWKAKSLHENAREPDVREVEGTIAFYARWLALETGGTITTGLNSMPASAPEEIFAALRDGNMVVMIAEEREDAEGDLVMAAEKITPDKINFMARNARGIISVAIIDKRFRELGITLAPSTENGNSIEQAGSLIDAREGATTGISAADRSRVIGRSISEVELPQGASIVAIARGEQVIMAHRETLIEAEDHLIVFLADRRHVDAVARLLQGER